MVSQLRVGRPDENGRGRDCDYVASAGGIVSVHRGRANGAIATTRPGSDPTIPDFNDLKAGYHSLIENEAIRRKLEGSTAKRKSEASN
jgi:hypothetical protein